MGIFKFIEFLKVTVNDCTTSICLLCYKQITSIVNFRERCARANEQFKKQCRQSVKPETILERPENTETECIPLDDLVDGEIVLPSQSLWTEDENFGEISGELFSYANTKFL